MSIAVLAVQGAFLEHRQALYKLGMESMELRQASDLHKPFDGLILPGGESTAMGKLLTDLHMLAPLQERIRGGLPVLGTCAGMILLSSQILDSDQPTLGTMDITVRRNAYGRQLGSFQTTGEFANWRDIPMTFIRAPYIQKAGEDVTVLSRCNKDITAARQKNQLVTAFHPELTEDTRIHQYFLDMVFPK